MRMKNIIIGTLLSVILSVFIIAPVSVKADAENPTKEELDEEVEDLSSLESWCYGMYVYMTEPPSTIADLLKVNSDYFTGSQAIETIMSCCSGLALYLVIIYLILEIDKIMLMSGGEFNFKQFIYTLMKFGVGIYICSNIIPIIEGLCNINNGLIEKATVDVTTLSPSIIKARYDVCEQLNEMDIFGALGALVALALGVLFAAVGNLLISMQCVSRTIELVIRGVFLPIAVADTYKGMDSTGWRYLKKFFACALCGVGFLGVIAVGQTIVASDIMGANSDISSFATIFKLVVVPLSMGGAASACKQVINDAMGV